MVAGARVFQSLCDRVMSPCQAPLSTTWALPSAGLTQEMPVQCLLFARNGASCLSLFSALDPPGASAGPAALSWQGRAVQVQGGQSSGLPSWPGAEGDYRRYNLRGLGAGRGLRGRGAWCARRGAGFRLRWSLSQPPRPQCTGKGTGRLCPRNLFIPDVHETRAWED